MSIVKVIDLLPGKVVPLQAISAEALQADEFWHRFVCRHEPVIIRGAAAGWPAVRHWAVPGYLESRCADEAVRLWRTFNPAPVLEGTAAMTRRPLKDCLREMREAPGDATFSIPGLDLPAGWAPDIGSLGMLSPRHERAPYGYPGKRLFVYRNASTEWHYHTIDETLTSQLVGRKRFSLFRPDRLTWDHVEPLVRYNYHHMPCGRQFFHADTNIVKHEGEAGPGDVIYIPPYWWHGVDPVDAELGVTLATCFRSPLRRFGSWSDPVTQELIGDVVRSNKASVPLLLAVLAASSLSRKIKGEPWWPMRKQPGAASS
ncbi:MAG: hypothetical protein JNL93_20565 [Pelomonas sp.]|nr:hypothetical protein [Roseateles sp.]